MARRQYYFDEIKEFSDKYFPLLFENHWDDDWFQYTNGWGATSVGNALEGDGIFGPFKELIQRMKDKDSLDDLCLTVHVRKDAPRGIEKLFPSEIDDGVRVIYQRRPEAYLFSGKSESD